MNDLQDPFVDVIEHLDLPDVDLVPAVLERLAADEAAETGTGDGQRSSSWLPALVGAAAVLAVGLIVVITPVGQAVADWFGIGATVFEVDDSNGEDLGIQDGPGDTASEPAETTASTAVSADSLGVPVEPVPDIVPIESLGRPDAVFDDARRGRTFVWNDNGTGSVLRLSVRSTFKPAWSVKSLASESDVEFLTVEVPVADGLTRPEPGVWISAPHKLTYPVDGLDLELTIDSGPVLLWVHDDIEFRLEGAGDKAEALTLAAQTRPGTELLPAG